MLFPLRLRRCLLKATCDKTALDRRALRLARCFQEAAKALCPCDSCPRDKKKAKKH